MVSTWHLCLLLTEWAVSTLFHFISYVISKRKLVIKVISIIRHEKRLRENNFICSMSISKRQSRPMITLTSHDIMWPCRGEIDSKYMFEQQKGTSTFIDLFVMTFFPAGKRGSEQLEGFHLGLRVISNLYKIILGLCETNKSLLITI